MAGFLQGLKNLIFGAPKVCGLVPFAAVAAL